MKYLYAWLLAIVLFVASNRAVAQTNTLLLRCKHQLGDAILQLHTQQYRNGFDEPITFHMLKYYLSNIVLTDTQGKEWKTKNFVYLIDENDSTSKCISINVGNLPIVAVSFSIGVDSNLQTAGVQSGVLDPLKGMFWSWNTGYVYAKIEAQSAASKAPTHAVSHHVGGYLQQQNALRKVQLTAQIPIRENLVLVADLQKWFNSVHALPIAQYPVCHTPGTLAMQLADNIAQMFSLSKLP